MNETEQPQEEPVPSEEVRAEAAKSTANTVAVMVVTPEYIWVVERMRVPLITCIAPVPEMTPVKAWLPA